MISQSRTLSPYVARVPQREVFVVDGIRVTFDEQRRWQCESQECRQKMHCAHVEQAQFFRQVRGTGPHDSADDTLEMHISEAELEALLEAPPVHPTEIRASEAVVSPRELRRSQWTMAIAAMAIAGIASALTYSFALRAAPSAKTAPPAPLAIHLAAEPAAAAPAPESPPPVRFANPFDPTEVFEFPAGTPEAEARDEVAEVLLERARHRLSESRDPKHSKI